MAQGPVSCTCVGGRTRGENLVEPVAPAVRGPTSAPVKQTCRTPEDAGHPSGRSRAREGVPRGSYTQTGSWSISAVTPHHVPALLLTACCHGSARTAGDLAFQAAPKMLVPSPPSDCPAGQVVCLDPCLQRQGRAGPSRAPGSWPAVRCSDTGKTASPRRLAGGPLA